MVARQRGKSVGNNCGKSVAKIVDCATTSKEASPNAIGLNQVENYSGDYFCEVCEEEFNPNGAFYHCDQCVQSMHPACCVPILQKETTHTHFYPDVGVAQFDNIKFGDSFKVNGHPHVVSLCRGVESDGECAKCGKDLEDKLILKCLQCKFAIDQRTVANMIFSKTQLYIWKLC
ncbi:zinc finger, PHD-type containing protein [Tanacetum coccineum]|uniref:Zinc finger, PHD-type containing protein n=1 Tax=Tanacetum coccineum TaxID=301880 RepID=A0ABQ5HL14_9ASTR